MNYKSIVLSALFMPFTSFGGDFQQMEKRLFEKELEISNFGGTIEAKGKLLSSYKTEVHDLFLLILTQRIQKLEREKGEMSEEDKNTIRNELIAEVEGFAQKIEKVLKNEECISGMLVDGLFQEDEFELLRFYFVRHALEQRLQKKLVEKYENHIQELLDLEIELIDFKMAKQR